jgi:hypothetical protein
MTGSQQKHKRQGISVNAVAIRELAEAAQVVNNAALLSLFLIAR